MVLSLPRKFHLLRLSVSPSNCIRNRKPPDPLPTIPSFFLLPPSSSLSTLSNFSHIAQRLPSFFRRAQTKLFSSVLLTAALRSAFFYALIFSFQTQPFLPSTSFFSVSVFRTSSGALLTEHPCNTIGDRLGVVLSTSSPALHNSTTYVERTCCRNFVSERRTQKHTARPHLGSKRPRTRVRCSGPIAR